MAGAACVAAGRAPVEVGAGAFAGAAVPVVALPGADLASEGAFVAVLVAALLTPAELGAAGFEGAASTFGGTVGLSPGGRAGAVCCACAGTASRLTDSAKTETWRRTNTDQSF